MTEESWGQLMAAAVHAEGHRPGLPASGVTPSAVARLLRDGMTHQAIADQLGCTRPRVSQIAAELRKAA